jgi:hypothetical protein
VAVGFNSQTTRDAWTAISDTSLVLLALYQGIVFVLVAVRLFKVWNRQKKAEIGGGASQTKYRTRGLGWIAFALFVGAVEAIVGFVHGGFEVILARRLLHVLSRGGLVVGLLMGYVASQGAMTPSDWCAQA